MLQDTAWRAAASVVGLGAIVPYWLVYPWQSALSYAGSYRYFSYSFHELYSAPFLLLPHPDLAGAAVMQVSVPSWTQVLEIPDEYHIVIQGGKGPATLSTTPLVTALVETDRTQYGFVYETSRSQPEEGQLNGIWRD